MRWYRLSRRKARQFTQRAREKTAGWSAPGQQYRVRPNRERWRDHDAAVVARIVRAQHRGELP